MPLALALKGIRVLDLSRLIPGPFATMVLAHLGAEVDKIEDPGAGDYLRHMPPLDAGTGVVFQALNRGKRSLVLNLKQEEGRQALRRLVPTYDVIVEGFRPGVMERLGLGYDELRKVHPGLVYCALSGYGQEGPMAGRAGHDLNYLARAGILGASGPSHETPAVPGAQMADIGGALFAVIGILSALSSRHSTGEGRFVDISLSQSAMAFGVIELLSAQGNGEWLRGGGLLTGGVAPYGIYETKDGGAVSLAALEPKFWASFCGAVDMEADVDALRPGAHQESWRERLVKLFRGRTRNEWAELGAKLDCCLEPVLEPTEVEFRIPTSPTESATTEPGDAAPTQGQHSREILADAGLDSEEI